MEKENRHSGGRMFEGRLEPKKNTGRQTEGQKSVQPTGAERKGWDRAEGVEWKEGE